MTSHPPPHDPHAPHSGSLSAQQALAREAVLHTLPLYEMARMRAATCPRRDAAGRFAGDGPASTLRWVNQITHTRELLGPRHRQVVTPNNDTLYTNAWLDLSRGPLLLEVPDSLGRYYVLGLLDFYTNPFGYIGTRTTGAGPGRFLLHAPGWQGRVPDGARAIACPTDAVWMIGRLLAEGEADLPAVHAFQDGIRLSRADGQPAAFAFDVAMRQDERPGEARRFAEVVNRALRDYPPDAQEAPLVARFAQVGIGAGCEAGALGEAQLAELAAALRAVLAELDVPAEAALGGGWSLPVAIRATFGAQTLQRAQVARNYIGALGIEEAMYVIAERDGDGVPLDGRQAYVLDFPAGGLPQVGAFWSLTLYDKRDCMLVENPLQRYSLGDRSPGLRHEADGGLRLHLSAAPPADPACRGNWLPAPTGPFYVVLRLYIPAAAHLDNRFAYPPLRRVEVGQ